MRIKSSPFGARTNTTIAVIDDWTIQVDGIAYHFDPSNAATIVDTATGDVLDPTPRFSVEANFPIIEAHLENGELFVTVRRLYGPDQAMTWGDKDFLPGGGYRGSTYETADEFADYESRLIEN